MALLVISTSLLAPLAKHRAARIDDRAADDERAAAPRLNDGNGHRKLA